MTNYTTKQLTGLKAPQVKEIAKGFKLPLSSNGKRFTKEELISSIIKTQSQNKRKATLEAKKNATYTGKQKGGSTHISLHAYTDYSNINLHNTQENEYSKGEKTVKLHTVGKGKPLYEYQKAILDKINSGEMVTVICNEMLHAQSIDSTLSHPMGCNLADIQPSTLDTNKVDTIVLQARKLLLSSQDNSELHLNIQDVKRAIKQLERDTKDEKKNMFQNKKRSQAIKLINVMITSYEKKVL